MPKSRAVHFGLDNPLLQEGAHTVPVLILRFFLCHVFFPLSPSSQHILQLHDELNAARKSSGDADVKVNWQQTSLRPFIEYFKNFVTNLMNASRAENPRAYAKQAGTTAEKEVGQKKDKLTPRQHVGEC